jgi:cytochrome c551
MEVKRKARSLMLKPERLVSPGYTSLLLLAFCLLLFSCAKKSESESQPSSPKFTQYYNQGEQLYMKHCSNCHQQDGRGLGRVYPPLNVSDFMNDNFNQVICLIRYGRSDDLIVNGVSFNQSMPGVGALTDLEIAEIVTYIYNSWSHKRGIADVKDVTEILNSCQPVKR